MRIDWPEPVTVHVAADVTDPMSSQLRRSAGGPVQLLLGSEMSVVVWLLDAATPVAADIDSVLDGVRAVEVSPAAVAAAVASSEADEGPTVAVKPVAAEAAPLDVAPIEALPAVPEAPPVPAGSQAFTRDEGDVDDTVLGRLVSDDAVEATILGQPALTSNADDDIDETILGQPAARSDADETILGQPALQGDSDETILGRPAASPFTSAPPLDQQSADTIIGSARRAVAGQTSGSPVASGPGIPPALPPMPPTAIPAAPTTTSNSRTRIDPARSSAQLRNAVRLADGRLIPLDRTVYVGRSPRSPRITSGEAPHLVAVPSPLREVSGTHLEIQQEGYTVVVRDVGSTNGTIVTAPGTAPSLLSPGESRVVPVGCALDLGDGNVLEIVAPAAVRLQTTAGSASW
jgi:hypothetical protein